jgi:hypothetical protein
LIGRRAVAPGARVTDLLAGARRAEPGRRAAGRPVPRSGRAGRLLGLAGPRGWLRPRGPAARRAVAGADVGALLLGAAQVGEPTHLVAADLWVVGLFGAPAAPASTPAATGGRVRPLDRVVVGRVGTA